MQRHPLLYHARAATQETVTPADTTAPDVTTRPRRGSHATAQERDPAPRVLNCPAGPQHAGLTLATGQPRLRGLGSRAPKGSELPVRLWTRLVIAFLVVVVLLGGTTMYIGSRLISRTVLREAQYRTELDLRSAR